MINYETRKYRLTGVTEILGSQPANKQVRSDYIASKAPSEEFADEEQDMLKLEEKGLTVFLRRNRDEALCMLDYQVRAFFKGAFTAMADQLKIKNVRHKVDTYLFVAPRQIPLMRDGKPLYDEDDIRERSLRADTPQGPRTALAASERVMDPWYIDIEICLLKNNATALSKEISFEAIEDALDYGMFQGLGQWRSGSNGRFRWERLDAADDEAEEAEREKGIEKRRVTEEPKKRGRKKKTEDDE